MRKHFLKQNELIKQLSYDPDTGVITRLVNSYSGRNNSKIQARAGDIAGTVNPDGYVRFCLNGVTVSAHLVAWVMHYGYTPEHDIDHINRDKTDNRASNLREVTRSCNIKNSPKQISNTSGFVGVNLDKRANRWRGYISTDGKVVGLGYYKNIETALSARVCAEILLDWQECDRSNTTHEFLKSKGLWPLPEKIMTKVYDRLDSKELIRHSQEGVDYGY